MFLVCQIKEENIFILRCIFVKVIEKKKGGKGGISKDFLVKGVKDI